MVLRLLTALSLSAVTGHGCTCFPPNVEYAKAHAEVVFRGTIVEFRDSGKDFAMGVVFRGDTKKLAVFRVSRVWKGEVGPTLEMPAVEETTMCIGFWPHLLKIGSDLLVYANRGGPGRPEYYTDICTRTAFAKDAKDDLDQLCPGEEPREPQAQRHTLEDVRFMSGHWIGSDGSNEIEEQWSEPSNGTMIGMYREMNGGKTTFYEFLVIAQEETGLVMRMKHFDANLVGREEKERSVVLDIASASKGEAVFVSRDPTKPTKLAYRRTSNTELTATLIRERDGKTLRDEFHYRLAP
jgi:hypothetical protein